MSTSERFPDLVPELLITDLGASLAFWVGLCGFAVRYDRRAEGFAYLQQGSAHLMLDQIGLGRDWVSGPMQHPLGRGVNFQVSVPSVDPLLERMSAAGWPLYLAPEDAWYRTGSSEAGQRQFLVQDPDGYLVRFAARLPARG